MPLRNTTRHWGGVAQLFHWVMAIGIFGMMALGWIMVNLPMGPTQFQLYSLHKSLGITLLTLAVLRLVWRLANPAPPLPADMAPWERRLAGATHVVLYAVIFAMPLSGYVINSAANFPLNVFGLVQIPNLTPESERLETIASWTHLTLFWVLSGLLVLHIGGALRHHFIQHDNVLRRMLPGRES